MSKTNNIYYKVVYTDIYNTGLLLNKDNPRVPCFRTEYKIGEWTTAKGNTRLFVFENLTPDEITASKAGGKRVFKCSIGTKNIKGNGVNYCYSRLVNNLKVGYSPYDERICAVSTWFWNNVEKNLKAKKKYCAGMEQYLFSYDKVVLTDKVKLLEQV